MWRLVPTFLTRERSGIHLFQGQRACRTVYPGSRTPPGASPAKYADIIRTVVAFTLCLASFPPLLGQPQQPCMAVHSRTGALVPAREQPGNSGTYTAIAFPDPVSGYPTITYGPQYAALTPLLQSFVRLHECAHLAIPTSDEIQANCRALREMRRQGLTAENEELIAQDHYNRGVLEPKYGGSGTAFWRLTLKCAGSRHDTQRRPNDNQRRPMGRSCRTRQVQCGPFNVDPLPLGAPCWCDTPWGRIDGQVVQP